MTSHNELLSSSPKGKEVLRGAHVDRYEFNEEPKQGDPVYLNVNGFLEGRREGSKFFDYKERRIGYQRGAAIDNWRRIIACVIDAGNFCSDTINYIVRPETDFYFVLGLLNSRLYEWRFRLTSTNNHVNSYEVDSLPLRPLNFTTPQAERHQLAEQGKKLYQKYLENKDWGKLMAFVSKRLPTMSDGTPDFEQEQSDVVHDLIAFLAEETTGLHKDKKTEIKGFLIWLENYLGLNLENLENMTKIREYWRTDVGWEVFLDALKLNQEAIRLASGIDVTRRQPQEQKIYPEFNTSMANLRPILEKIELTDNLIDQIVYRLYGLTNEEIEIVKS